MTEERTASTERAGEQGFMLLGLIVAIALILLALSVAAVNVAFSLRREREVESARRADQYVRAIRRYYLKFQHYPGSVEQLENTNNMRFLRQRYYDPLTGKQDYRLILVGQNKTTAKGFFGAPLTGLAAGGIGTQTGGTTAPTGPGATPAAGAAAPGAPGNSGSGFGSFGSSGSGFGSSGSSGSFGSQTSSGGGAGSGGPFMGVGSSATGNSILVVNEQTSYQSWEFLYDPRIEQLKAAAALKNGLSGGGGSSNPTQPTGGFGSQPQGGFGSQQQGGPGNQQPGQPPSNPPNGTPPQP